MSRRKRPIVTVSVKTKHVRNDDLTFKKPLVSYTVEI